ncbi:hypothetical protein BSK49_12635 [Paenibacillus odorifer]|jgi:hypothetical protein|uniref:Uncharacterized protein n=1 Tax=Paenibacillus odorifer TaxID=189426 RepID=A0ABX3GFZ6_9BACL|nr:hypothetical protein BSO21_34255 [Paenibacillus odorifer]OMD89233.1 hypothetical protein BSK49_12635 [Paenibacillus odorifer]
MFGDAESEMWEMGHLTCKFAECEMRCVEMRMWKYEISCTEALNNGNSKCEEQKLLNVKCEM